MKFYRPSTAEVLQIIGKAGVVVGSAAWGGGSGKDVDVVVKPVKDGQNPVFKALGDAFLGQCQSEAIGHFWVDAKPVPVELFVGDRWLSLDLDDPFKNENRVTYNQALKASSWSEVYGVRMRVVLTPKLVLVTT